MTNTVKNSPQKVLQYFPHPSAVSTRKTYLEQQASANRFLSKGICPLFLPWQHSLLLQSVSPSLDLHSVLAILPAVSHAGHLSQVTASQVGITATPCTKHNGVICTDTEFSLHSDQQHLVCELRGICCKWNYLENVDRVTGMALVHTWDLQVEGRCRRRRREVPLEATVLLHKIPVAREHHQVGGTPLKSRLLETVQTCERRGSHTISLGDPTQKKKYIYIQIWLCKCWEIPGRLPVDFRSQLISCLPCTPHKIHIASWRSTAWIAPVASISYFKK